jgi:hypothetical protein
VQRANDFRAITGEGFTFLNIPRTYYGLLDAAYLAEHAKISQDEASSIISNLIAAGICDDVGAVKVSLYEDSTQLDEALASVSNAAAVKKAVISSIYRNMYLLLKDSISEDMYIT